jgi:septum site-determining protein MinC
MAHFTTWLRSDDAAPVAQQQAEASPVQGMAPAPVRIEQGLIDLSECENATQALLLLAQTLQTPALEHWNDELDVNTGYIFLSPAQVRRIAKLLEDAGKPFGVLFTQVPQSQQAALNQGYMVRENAVIRPARRITVQAEATSSVLREEGTVPQEASLQNAAAFAQALEEADATETKASTATAIQASALTPQVAPIGESNLESQSHQVMGAFECEPMLEATPSSSEQPSNTVGVDHFNLPTKILRGNLRSGRFETHEGHLLVIGDVHTGAELRVKGDVVVWGELRGLVHAGYKGSREAEVRALKLDAVQIRIADIMARRPDRHSQLPTAQEPWHAPEGSYFPEIARVVEGEIQLYTTRRHHS